MNVFQKVFFMIKFFVVTLSVVLLPILAFSQQILTLDKAIAESMDYFAQKLPSNAKVAVLKMEAPNYELAEYISVECENYIKDNTPLITANKKGLESVLKQRNISDLNKADDDEILNVARLIGANVVVFGEFSKRGENYRFFIQALDTKTAEIKGMLSLRVGLDELLADFTGEKYVAPNVAKTENKEDIASVKKELEEIKALLAQQQSAQKQSNSGDVRARLENEMNDRQKSDAPKVSLVGSEGIGRDEQIVIIDAGSAECFLDVYFDGEFIVRMNEESVQSFVLKKGTHAVMLAKVKNKGGVWQTLQVKDASFTLLDYAVKLDIGTMRGRLGNIDIKREKSPQNYLHKNKVLRVNTRADNR